MIAADGDMLSDWESMTIDELFALRDGVDLKCQTDGRENRNRETKRLRQLSPSLEAEREKCGRP